MADVTGQQAALIPHDYQGQVITQRSSDGYINATAMCKAAGKVFTDYCYLEGTKDFLEELSTDLSVPLSALIQEANNEWLSEECTWVHPQVSIHLAQWASSRFAVKVSRWVTDWHSGRGKQDLAWRQFQDRISLVHNSVPEGFFCIFHETASIYATLIEGGVNPGARMILDISAGLHWSKHWRKELLANRFGDPRKYEHNYPDYFPQALSNPQRPWCYPDAALPEFRRWMREIFESVKLPAYLEDQVRQGKLPANDANNVLAALEQHSAKRLK